MSVKRRLIIGSASVMFLLVVLATTAVVLLEKFNHNIETVVEKDYQKIVLLNRLGNDFSSYVKLVREAESFENESETFKFLNAVDEKRSDIEVTIASLENVIVQREAISTFRKLKVEYQNYNNLVDLYLASDSRVNRPFFNEESVRIQTELLDNITQLTNVYEQDMEEITEESQALFENTRKIIIILSTLVIGAGLVIAIIIIRNITKNLNLLLNGIEGFTSGKLDLTKRLSVKSKDEFGKLADAFNRMIDWLQEKTDRERETAVLNEEQAWLKSNIAEITVELQGNPDLQSLAKTFVSKVTPLVRGNLGVLYITEDSDEDDAPDLRLVGSYAYKERKHLSDRFSFGEGLVGQAAYEKETILLTDVPDDYIKINSGVGEATPLNIIVLPLIFKGKVLGVLEVASFHQFKEIEKELLEQLTDSIGIVIENIKGQMRTEELLEESQVLTEELQTQAEELEVQQKELEQINAELEQQTKALKESERVLQQQQEELEHNNTELEEKAQQLAEQNQKFEQKSQEAEKAKVDAEEKAKQLELISKYKSEFLANMSHELRTPLNSLLILAKLLSENKEGNFTDKQVEFVKTIYSSGADLLNLINDILDLSKVESGNMEVYKSRFLLNDVKRFVEDTFKPVAENKGIEFDVQLSNTLPKTVFTDKKRFEQIIKNLLSNAFKFTERGHVNLNIRRASEQELQQLTGEAFHNGDVTVAFSISDTGIGIPKDKQEIIFDAFQQVDGTTSRKYEGTGLGLSISREFASMLGGDIKVESIEGEGSTFTLYLPISYVGPNEVNQQEETPIIDARDEIASTRIADPVVTDIPPIEDVVSDEELVREMESDRKRILVVEDDATQRNSIVELIQGMYVDIVSVSSGEEALQELTGKFFDCMILDLGLSKMSGYELLEEIEKESSLHYIPVLIYTGRDLSSKDELRLKKHAKTIIMKDIYSPERLLEEVSYLLNKKDEDLSNVSIEHVQETLQDNHFEGKKILIVDDDIRNVFALSNMLEHHEMEVLFAENGREGIETLQRNEDIDLVLMDVMMPEMDGYEATQKIRSNPEFKSLPIIALTAKAMKDDRKKCLDAGASDYIAKPINNDQLLSLMRVWLYK
ncbi:response regulator [Salirhabdus salicampi]|uniref:response regulator n=1 Tax=Salirhabdus salicampi TaxID=476102 RepID=UPI0020C2FE5A|nr:response regulator [Salirhabdus salicampi]MCP8617885.1 response regulator [Salirhabdus salicampi]